MSDVPAAIVDYVRSTARFLELPLDEAQVQRVSVHLARTRMMVAELATAELAPEDELAEMFRPAPFPSEGA